MLCSNPIQEITNQLRPEDVLAIVWDDSPEAHLVIHSLEDFALETWNIEDGLEPIEIDYNDDADTEDLYDQMSAQMHLFVDSLAAYLVSAVVDALTESLAQRIAEDEGKKDISPFED